ncbi:MAG: hypothetical protein IPG09_04950 [Ignavibacteria bacterium]|nr:hypothetical protein [Ignavibacteria bacterium]
MVLTNGKETAIKAKPIKNKNSRWFKTNGNKNGIRNRKTAVIKTSL